MTHSAFSRCAALAVVVTLSWLSPAFAFDQKPFDEAEFKAAQAAGKPVVAHVTAPWCPTCTAQHKTLDSLAKNPAYDAVTVFKVDFDEQEAAWKSLDARAQSTLIAFAGEKETGRLVGETAAEPIEKLLQSTITK